MKVSIKGSEYDYTSDFPKGWMFAGGDYFKYPVIIGSNKCFVKRFKTKNPQSITGWQLMNSMLDKIEQNLPIVHDIIKVQENNREIYYIFFEFSEGKTLESAIAENEKIDLDRLNVDMFKALRSLNKYNHWFPDFCEKNILCDKSGRFLLIDLDSTYPVSVLPDGEMDCNQEYWALVFKFYSNILDSPNFEPSDINGISFNYLQLVFLILRLKKFYSGSEEQYAALHNSLPQYLAEAGTEFEEIFKRAFKVPDSSFSSGEIAELQNLIVRKIIYEDIELPAPDDVKEFINNFTISNHSGIRGGGYVVNNRKPFTINWEVEKKCSLELFRNRLLYKKLDSGKNTLDVTEFYDGKEKSVVYYLEARYEERVEKSESITIMIEPESAGAQSYPASPAILEFTADKRNVMPDEIFLLRWRVEKATRMTLYRNGVEYKKLRIEDKNIKLLEPYDQNVHEVQFILVAENESSRIESPSVIIDISPGYEVVSDPLISEFATDKLNVMHQEPFVLRWNVENANNITLYRNGKEYKKINIQDKNISLFEPYDKKEREVEFWLVAENEKKKYQSPSLKMVISPAISLTSPPVIHLFSADKYNVNDKETFVLKWEVENATKIALYRNNNEYRKIKANERNIQLIENYNEKDNKIEFRLIVENDAGPRESQKIIITVVPKIKQQPAPVIRAFTTNKQKVRSGENFLLQWKVDNASNIMLFRNGEEYKKIKIGNKNIQLSETYQENATNIEFKLIALNESVQVSSSLRIKVTDEHMTPKPPLLHSLPLKKIGYGLAAAIALVLLFILVRNLINKNSTGANIQTTDSTKIIDTSSQHVIISTQDSIVDVNPLSGKVLTAGQMIAITGKNFPLSADSFSVFFNRIPGAIKTIKKDMILLKVPTINSTKNSTVDIVVFINHLKFPVANGVTVKNPVKKLLDSTITIPKNRITISDPKPSDTIYFIHNPQGDKLFILVNNRSVRDLQDVVITISCDSVVNGSNDIRLKSELMNVGNIARHSDRRYPASNTISNLYNIDRPKKRIRLQLSFK